MDVVKILLAIFIVIAVLVVNWAVGVCTLRHSKISK
jgi:hypothetical protein